jgi:hypothetical protein
MRPKFQKGYANVLSLDNTVEVVRNGAVEGIL